MDYLIRYRQMHETFRQPETVALAELNGFTIDWISYSNDVGKHPTGRRRAAVHPQHVLGLLRVWSVATRSVFSQLPFAYVAWLN